jgi:hypothetical protein
MTSLVLDAGALVAADRADRRLRAALTVALEQGWDLRVPAMVIAQAWRDPSGRQVQLGRLLRAADVRPVDGQIARAAGVLCGRARTSDPVDATVVLAAEPGDRIVTSDPGDIAHLVEAAGITVTIATC